jgi:hypothetical protein
MEAAGGHLRHCLEAHRKPVTRIMNQLLSQLHDFITTN